MRRWMPTTVVTLLAALTVSLIGCGVGEQDEASRIDPADLELLRPPLPMSTPPDTEPAAVTTTTGPDSSVTPPDITAAPVTKNVTMYFIAGDRIVPMNAVAPTTIGLRALVRRLESGPPDEHDDEGVRSALPPGLIRSLDHRVDAVTVDLNGELFDVVDPQDQQLLFGQVVLTLTDLPAGYGGPIARVRFTLDGHPLSVTRRDNTLSAPGAFVSRWDYEPLLESSATRLRDTTAGQ